MSCDKKDFTRSLLEFRPVSFIQLIDVFGTTWQFHAARASFGKIGPIAGCGAVNGKISLKKRL